MHVVYGVLKSNENVEFSKSTNYYHENLIFRSFRWLNFFIIQGIKICWQV